MRDDASDVVMCLRNFWVSMALYDSHPDLHKVLMFKKFGDY